LLLLIHFADDDNDTSKLMGSRQEVVSVFFFFFFFAFPTIALHCIALSATREVFGGQPGSLHSDRTIRIGQILTEISLGCSEATGFPDSGSKKHPWRKHPSRGEPCVCRSTRCQRHAADTSTTVQGRGSAAAPEKERRRRRRMERTTDAALQPAGGRRTQQSSQEGNLVHADGAEREAAHWKIMG
jgi:hypothetical protein